MTTDTGCNEKQRSAMIERTLMGSVVNGDVLPSQLGLKEQDFADSLCRRLFVLASAMQQRRQEIDLPGICMADESIDAQQVIAMVGERCISDVLIQQHSAKLRELALERRFELLLRQTIDAMNRAGDARAAMTALHGQIALELTQAQQEQEQGARRSMLMMILDVMAQYDPQEKRTEPIATGIDALDERLTGGFRPGDLVVVAALTSVGKSAMLAFMMRNAARQGKKILLVSCEMSDEQNAERYMAAISGIALENIIRRKPMTEQESLALSDGMEIYHPENIQVISSGTQTVDSVRREAMQMKMSGGLDMIVVDYLQRLHPSQIGQNKAEAVGSVAAGLKSMAVDLNVPVLTAAQFNRDAAKNRHEAQGKEAAGVPALHQLRDSSQIEDEANTVIVLDEPQRVRTGARRINAHVVKNRSGALGAIRLRFDPQTMTYCPAELREENA